MALGVNAGESHDMETLPEAAATFGQAVDDIVRAGNPMGSTSLFRKDSGLRLVGHLFLWKIDYNYSIQYKTT
jgi:hypothetical protein